MKAHLKFIILLTFISLLPCCNEFCEWYETQYLEQCQAQHTGLIAGNVGDHYQKTATVWRFAFNLPGSSADNCDLKFLEHKEFIEIDSIELVRWPEHNVGNALYIVNSITDINNDSSLYVLKQIRETFDGVFNNDGVCDGGNNPALINFFVRFKKCKEYTIVGDSFGLRIYN